MGIQRFCLLVNAAAAVASSRTIPLNLHTKPSGPISPAVPPHWPSSSIDHVVSFRGGGQVIAELGNIDLARTKLRLESFNTYGLVNSLLLQAALKLYCGIYDEDLGLNKQDLLQQYNTSSKLEFVTKCVFVLSAAVCIICGAYSTVVFSLLGLYCKTALGMGWDDRFLQFYTVSSDVRKSAFDAFMMTLWSFEICFTASLLLKKTDSRNHKIRLGTTALAIVAGIGSWLHWNSIIAAAKGLVQ